MKSILVYMRPDGWYLRPMSQTTVMLWVGVDPCVKEPLNISVEQLGAKVLELLEQSGRVVPHPTEWDSIVTPILNLAGVKTWGRFMKDVPSVNVDQVGERFYFRLFRNEGPRRGYGAASSPALELPVGSSAQAVGETLLRAIDLCE